MKKIKEVLLGIKETLLSLDKKNKAILGVGVVLLVGVIVFGVYKLSFKPNTDPSIATIVKAEADKDSTKKEESKDKNKEETTKKEDSNKLPTSDEVKNEPKKDEVSKPQTTTPQQTKPNSGGNTPNKPAPTPVPPKPQPTPTPTPPKPQPQPQPQPQPAPPVKPQLTVANCPEHHKYGGVLFATMAEAEKWYYEQTMSPSSPNYGKTGIISTITDYDFTGQIYKVGFHQN